MMQSLIILGVSVVVAFTSGYKVSSWKRDSEMRHAEQIQKISDDAERGRIEAVATTYQQLTTELQRIRTGIKTEVFHETQKIEYRCIVPDSGRVLINTAISAANKTIAGIDAKVSNDRQARN